MRNASPWSATLAALTISAAGCAELDQAGESQAALPLLQIGGEVGVEAPAAGYATGPSADEPVVAWGSNAYLVVWRDDSIDNKMDVFARRVSRDGQVLGRGPILLTTSALLEPERCPASAAG